MDMNQLLPLMLLTGGGRGGLFGGGGGSILGLMADSQNWFLAKIMGKRYTQRMAMLALLMSDSGKQINRLQIITQQPIRRRRRRSYRRRYRRRY